MASCKKEFIYYFLNKSERLLKKNNIGDIKRQSKTGRIILCSSKTKQLTNSMRNKLCTIIITYMEDHNIVTLGNNIRKMEFNF
ncbi:hypothetical protein PUN28_019671 [Cardiocondyla obscurior]|uniref:Uncharacterized protein n=1 Tax=Cardiocondyla obscurior TaxID=286306 RepID=A0AAW2EA07_9HYME